MFNEFWENESSKDKRKNHPQPKKQITPSSPRNEYFIQWSIDRNFSRKYSLQSNKIDVLQKEIQAPTAAIKELQKRKWQ